MQDACPVIRVLKARNKYYLVDAALRNAVLLRGEEVLGNSQEMGVIVETTVLRHLFAYYYRDTPQIGYWRNSKTEREVDIIVQSPQYVIAVEVKYREGGAPGPGLYEFLAEREGTRHAYVVTKLDEDFGPLELPSKVPALRVPAHVLTYLLGQAERLLWKT